MSPQHLWGEWGQSRLLASQPHLHWAIIHLSSKRAKLQTESLTPNWLGRPLQTAGTQLHFAVVKSLLSCTYWEYSVSTWYKKAIFSRPQGNKASIRLTCQFVAHIFTCTSSPLHQAEKRCLWCQLFVLGYLSKKGVMGVHVCMRERRNWTYFPNLHRTLVHSSDEPASFSPAGRTAPYLTPALTANTSCLCCSVGWVSVIVAGRGWEGLKKYIEQNSIYFLSENITHSAGSSQLSLIVLFTLEGPKMTPISKGSYFTFISLGHLNKQNKSSLQTREMFLLKSLPEP